MFIIAVWGPSISGFILAAVTEGKKGLLDLFMVIMVPNLMC
jgi:hypothetical protein